MQAMLRAGLTAMLWTFAGNVMAQDAAVNLTKPPELLKGLDAFPRVLGSGPQVERINAGLAQADARAVKAANTCHAMSTKADWSRRIDVTMAGPRFISFISHDEYFCGTAHPNNATIALVYDLTTGRPVDWSSLLPASLAGKAVTVTSGDGTVLGVLSSPALKAFYLKELKPDADCVDDLNDTDFHFMLSLDAKANGLVLDQDDLPHAIQACGGTVTMTVGILREAGANPELVGAIQAAHKAQQASPGGRAP